MTLTKLKEEKIIEVRKRAWKWSSRRRNRVFDNCRTFSRTSYDEAEPKTVNLKNSVIWNRN